jgi:alpha,alpha-trehalase
LLSTAELVWRGCARNGRSHASGKPPPMKSTPISAARASTRFVQHYGSRALDASVLLMVLLRFLPPDDPRIRATVLAIADELTVDGLVLRYRVDETDDGLTGHEGSFVMCSFWLVSALSEIGENRRARQLCEKLLSLASPLGLYAEEIEPATGRHLGNYPQAFTHLSLINAVMHVVEAEQQAYREARAAPDHLVF